MDLCDDAVAGTGGNLQFVEIFEFGLRRYCFSSYPVRSLASLYIEKLEWKSPTHEQAGNDTYVGSS
jgi:hypothetical protein